MTKPVGSPVRQIDKLNLTSTGNAISFGELMSDKMRCGASASPIRGIFAGGFSYPGSTVPINTIESIEFASNGSSVDFGELTMTKHQFGGTSDSHGGLGGY